MESHAVALFWLTARYCRSFLHDLIRPRERRNDAQKPLQNPHLRGLTIFVTRLTNFVTPNFAGSLRSRLSGDKICHLGIFTFLHNRQIVAITTGCRNRMILHTCKIVPTPKKKFRNETNDLQLFLAWLAWLGMALALIGGVAASHGRERVTSGAGGK